LRSILQDLAVSEEFELRDRLNIALAEADWQPSDFPDMRENIAAGAIDAYLKDGNSEAAGALMGRIESPMTLTTMAIDRHYEPLWPAIEEALGAEQGRAIDYYVGMRLDGYANNGGDSAALRDAVIAYRLLGRWRTAAEIAERAVVSADMDEATFVTARIRAGILIALGEDDEAIALLETVTALDPQVTPFVPSAYVSLAEFLDILHRPEAALDVARHGMENLADRLSAYGRGWLRRTEICALTALDRREEAAPLAVSLAGDREDNPAAAIEAQLCFGDDDRAAALAIATLETREGAEQIADQFLTDEMLGSQMTVYLRAMWQRLLARADVREAFDRRLRLLPRELWPSSDPRPVPRREQVPTPPGLITT
jgi:tetratricopeptide (TPR) repeat protein